MLKEYIIHNFKNHADTRLELGNLTILTGINGMGKSSVLQSMLVLRESYMRTPLMQTLSLDGESFSIGRTAGLVNRSVTSDQNLLKISISSDEGNVDFAYQYPVGDANELEMNDKTSSINTDTLNKISLFTDQFQYLSAFRLGPQSDYQSQTSVVDTHRQISKKMGMGEYAVYFLSKFGQENIPVASLAYEGSSSMSLKQQTELWMGEISEGVRLQIDQKGTQYDLKYGYEKPGKPTAFHSAMNTGFGISYVLAIVVAVLSAKPGALLLIENPEAHIHPSGQSALMRLLSLAAANGIQIILETHSDHIVNGALVNWKLQKYDRSQLAVYYFDRDDSLNASLTRLTVGENGRIQNAPAGFFDQMRSDLEVLFDID